MCSVLGQRWRKLDLHIHTPASHDWVGGDISPEELVEKALSEGLDAIAVTDHNTAEWIDRLKTAAASSGLVLFPGVEISVSGGKGGIHILAIFDPSASGQAIDDLLAAAGIRSDKRGTEEALTDKSVADLLKVITEHRAIPILAHADSDKGVLEDMRGQQRIRVMNDPRVGSVEVGETEKYRRLLDGSDSNYRRSLPVHRASDNRSTDGTGHDLEGIGTRFTLFKMDEIGLESLRQCFCDPDVRIRTDEDIDPRSVTHGPWISKLEVSSGFLAGTHRFHEGLNCIVGGKGVGKSLLIEFLRFALDQASKLPAIHEDHLGKLRQQLGKGASVTVEIVTRGGEVLSITREFDAETNPITAVHTSDGRAYTGDLGDLFPIMAYSQTEAVDIARSERAQLQLVDQLLDLSALRRKARETRNDLSRLDQKIAECAREREHAEQLETDLAGVREQIEEIDRLLASGKHEAYRQLREKVALLRRVAEAGKEHVSAVRSAAKVLNTESKLEIPRNLSTDPDITTSLEELRTARSEAAEAIEKAAQKLDPAQKALSERQTAVEEEAATAQKEYEAWAKEIGGDAKDLVRRRARLATDRERLEDELDEARGIAEGLSAFIGEREEFLDQLDEIRRQIFVERRTKYDSITETTEGRLRLSLERDGNRDALANRLVEICRGSYARQDDLGALAENIDPRKLGSILFSGSPDDLASEAGIDLDLAKRVFEGAANNLDQTELLGLQHEPVLEDAPTIELLREDGSYGTLSALSVGQKSTALLIIALSDDDAPILIDQPEDALDLASVFEDITTPIRSRKEQRQFILTTHNPTVAVAGDADRFQILKASADNAVTAAEGAIERRNVRKQVILHLEGGDKTYALKSRKYGHAEYRR